jgi:hypothetical protein
MKAELLFREREGLTETAFVELVIWRVQEPVRDSQGDSVLRPISVFGVAARADRDSDPLGNRPDGNRGWI